MYEMGTGQGAFKLWMYKLHQVGIEGLMDSYERIRKMPCFKDCPADLEKIQLFAVCDTFEIPHPDDTEKLDLKTFYVLREKVLKTQIDLIEAVRPESQFNAWAETDNEEIEEVMKIIHRQTVAEEPKIDAEICRSAVIEDKQLHQTLVIKKIKQKGETVKTEKNRGEVGPTIRGETVDD